MLRITGISAGAVEYLLRGCGCHPEKDRVLDLERDLENGLEAAHASHEHGHQHERGAERERDAAGYFEAAVGHGEPAGRWLGEGMAGLSLPQRAGDEAMPDDVRAIFGQVRYPWSSEKDPEFIGSKPYEYPDAQERLERLLAQEPGGTAEGPRLAELEARAAGGTRQSNAYYDWTFSPDKSVSVYYAALIAAGATDVAEKVREAHEQAVRAAMAYADPHVGWTRTGNHGRNRDGDRVGQFNRGTGLTAVAFGHSTSRENEPQLHTHVAVLNRIATLLADGTVHIGALDSRGFAAMKEAVDAAYTRHMEDALSELGAEFVERPDGIGRQIAGIDPELIAEASTRRSQVLDRVAELTATYIERNGHEPGPVARKKLADAAAYYTRKPKNELSGPAGVIAWGDARRDWLVATVEQVAAEAVAVAVDRAIREGRGPVATEAERAAALAAERVATPEAQVAIAGDRPGAQVAGLAADIVDRDGRVWTVEETVARAVAAAVDEVQTTYATWTLGNLAARIDKHLPSTQALRIDVAARPAWVEAIARHTVDPSARHRIVQLTGHEPVAVPESMLREGDAQPRFRPHMDQRYATAAHLTMEEAVIARARQGGAPALAGEVLEAVRERCAARGLSADQVEAVVGVLGSGRAGDVLIGPAGTGKSRTVAALAAEWPAVAAALAAGPEVASGDVVTATAPGGRVIGVAMSNIATRNLHELGLEAENTTVFLARREPDEHGQVRDQLRRGDLVVVDEAGMASSPHTDRISELAAAAGAKVLYTGDAGQLDAPGAGGLFAVLSDRVDPEARHELDQVHRLRHEWEKAASVRWRDGDASVFDDYQARGRVRFGTLEAMQVESARDAVTDRLAGRETVLVTSTNEQARTLAKQVQDELHRLGVIGDELTSLTGGGKVRLGDRVMARENDYRIRVDPVIGPDGIPGEARPVTNRELYTVVGISPGEAPTLLVRDERGALAHLPHDYVAEHVSLGYAGTSYAVQSLTVETSGTVAGRGMSRQDAYVGVTRGQGENRLYLVTEREPDQHEPQRQAQLARERFGELMGTDGSNPAAMTVRDDYEADMATVRPLAARIEVEGRQAARERHDAVLERLVGDGVLPGEVLDRLRGQGERKHRERLEHALLEAEADGHDSARLLADAVSRRELHTAESVADVLRHRVRVAAAGLAPEREAAGGSWASLVARDVERDQAEGTTEANERGTLLGKWAELGDDRGRELARRAAEAADAAPVWVREWFGPAPDRDTDPAARERWGENVRLVGQYRELRGIEDEQLSIGAAPSRERVHEHALWRAAAAVMPEGADPAARNWARADDVTLYETRERWDRLVEQGPQWSGDELAAAHREAREADAREVRASRWVVTSLARGDNHAANEHAAAGAEARAQAVAARERAVELEAAHGAHAAWWETHAPDRHAAEAAVAELDRRNLPSQRMTGPDAVPDPPHEQQLLLPDTAPDSGHGTNRRETREEAELEEDTRQEPGQETPGTREPRQEAQEPERESAREPWRWDAFMETLRAEHGERLDPDRELSDDDLAHAWSAELTEARTDWLAGRGPAPAPLQEPPAAAPVMPVEPDRLVDPDEPTPQEAREAELAEVDAEFDPRDDRDRALAPPTIAERFDTMDASIERAQAAVEKLTERQRQREPGLEGGYYSSHEAWVLDQEMEERRSREIAHDLERQRELDAPELGDDGPDLDDGY